MVFNRLYQERQLRKVKKLLSQINALKEEMAALSDEEMATKTEEFRQRLARGETLDELLVEAYALVREADKRVLGLFPKPTQMRLVTRSKNGFVCPS